MDSSWRFHGIFSWLIMTHYSSRTFQFLPRTFQLLIVPVPVPWIWCSGSKEHSRAFLCMWTWCVWVVEQCIKEPASVPPHFSKCDQLVKRDMTHMCDCDSDSVTMCDSDSVTMRDHDRDNVWLWLWLWHVTACDCGCDVWQCVTVTVTCDNTWLWLWCVTMHDCDCDHDCDVWELHDMCDMCYMLHLKIICTGWHNSVTVTNVRKDGWWASFRGRN